MSKTVPRETDIDQQEITVMTYLILNSVLLCAQSDPQK